MTQTIKLKAGHAVVVEDGKYYEEFSAPAPEKICGRQQIRFADATDLLRRAGKKSQLAKLDPMYFMRGNDELIDNTPSHKEDAQ